MVELQPSKLVMRVRFPSPAPQVDRQISNDSSRVGRRLGQLRARWLRVGLVCELAEGISYGLVSVTSGVLQGRRERDLDCFIAAIATRILGDWMSVPRP